MKSIFLAVIVQFILIVSFAQTFKPGDKVEINNSGGWYKGSVQQIGSGEWAGYYKVTYDGYTGQQWMKASNIKMQAIAAAAPSTAAGPRSGMYIILSYGNPSNPLRLGYFSLAGGQYIYYDMAKKVIGKGAYIYDAGSQTVQWKSGPFKESFNSGAFEIDRGGKTHKVRLNSVTIGSNSTDS